MTQATKDDCSDYRHGSAMQTLATDPIDQRHVVLTGVDLDPDPRPWALLFICMTSARKPRRSRKAVAFAQKIYQKPRTLRPSRVHG